MWDLVDIGSFGWSLYDFIKCPSLGTVVGLALDTLGLLPLVPALGTLQRIDDLYDDLRWADEAFDARRGFSTNGYTPGLCFAAGTEIATAEGEKAIEDIEVGDLVWALDEQTRETKPRQVVGTFSRIATRLIVLSVGGEFIETTPEHPFWVIGEGWVEAHNLAVGDRLWTLHGDRLAIDRIEYREGSFPVYNFEVDGFHTYFVSQKKALVHNSCAVTKSGDEFLLDTNVVIADGKRFVNSGQNVVKSSVTDIELSDLVRRGKIKMPGAASDIPSVGLPGVNARINARAGLTPGRRGNFADGIIGGSALERGAILITRDQELLRSIINAGGRAIKP